MTREEKNELIEEVLEALMARGKSIDQLNEQRSIDGNESIELGSGNKTRIDTLFASEPFADAVTTIVDEALARSTRFCDFAVIDTYTDIGAQYMTFVPKRAGTEASLTIPAKTNIRSGIGSYSVPSGVVLSFEGMTGSWFYIVFNYTSKTFRIERFNDFVGVTPDEKVLMLLHNGRGVKEGYFQYYYLGSTLKDTFI